MPYANRNGIRIYYEVEGKGPPLVMLHGFAGSLEDWRDDGYVDALKRDYQLILVDSIGHGKSDKPHLSNAYTTEGSAHCLISVLDALHITKTYVMGYSGGGVDALILAKYAIDRVRSVILIGSGPQASTPDSIGKLRQLLEAGPAAYVAAMEYSELLRTKFKERLLANDFKALITITNSSVVLTDLTDSLSYMTMPFLVLLAEYDKFASPKKLKQVFSAVPKLTFVEFSGLYHGTLINRSDLLVPHIKEFLAQVNKT
jgi:pimeloyl-ACP methyl ester carboxylesterase